MAAALLVGGVAAARIALRPDRSEWTLPVVDAPAPRRPFLVMNPRSGGGKVGRFHLQERAEALGAEVALLDRPGTDVQQLARDALARGADLLGVAGGDGTQALVAQVAAEHDVPFLVISAGTRNHFALDLGLDREDPARCLDALRDGVEARIDLGEINGRPFVNNASFGAYAEIVESPAYRDDKRGTTLEALPDLLQRPARRPPRRPTADGLAVDAPAGVLVSNNPYEDVRPRRDGTAGPARPRRARGDRRPGGHGPAGGRACSTAPTAGACVRAEAPEVVVTADVPEIPVGIDGETVRLPTPVRCTVRPAPSGCGCPASDRASARRGAGWTGRRCGRWRSAGRPAPAPTGPPRGDPPRGGRRAAPGPAAR